MSRNNLEQLRKTIEEQKKIINFFQTKFIQQTGNQLTLPQAWSKFLNIEDENAPINDIQTGDAIGEAEASLKDDATLNFIQSFYAMNLPQKKINSKKKNERRGGRSSFKNKKNQLSTTFDQNNPDHMIQKINLSGFARKVLQSITP